MPLTDERIGNQDQNSLDQPSHQIFTKQQAGFNRFAEAYFVCQQRAASKPPHHLADCFDLMRQMFDTCEPVQTQQFIETSQ